MRGLIRRSISSLGLAAVLGWAWTGCGGEAQPEVETVRVFAAASLSEAFEDLETRFEALHPDVEVELVTAGSQVLRLQIEAGAPADVFASADEEHLSALADGGLAVPGRVFAENRLALVVPRGNPDGIEQLVDLPAAEQLIVGTPEVPLGAYTEALLTGLDPALSAAIRARVVSRERNARQVRSKVELGVADAAIVYRTDALATEALDLVPLPEAEPIAVRYAIAPLVEASERGPWPARFVDFVSSPAGQALLAARGFGPTGS